MKQTELCKEMNTRLSSRGVDTRRDVYFYQRVSNFKFLRLLVERGNMPIIKKTLAQKKANNVLQTKIISHAEGGHKFTIQKDDNAYTIPCEEALFLADMSENDLTYALLELSNAEILRDAKGKIVFAEEIKLEEETQGNV
jgi:hypothetical protein